MLSTLKSHSAFGYCALLKTLKSEGVFMVLQSQMSVQYRRDENCLQR
jgi:hypothetical protein